MSSRGRGRGVGTVKLKGPNLSLAGKKEEKSEPSENKRNDRTHRGRGGNRGRGARGGGRGGFRDKPALIQSEGIFSEGLAALDSKKQKPKDESSYGYSAVRTPGDAKNGLSEIVEPCSAKTKFEGYEALWTCDEDEETAELEDLMRDGILSDYKRGKILPVVLPRHDEIQFMDLLPMSIKEEVLSDGEEDRQEALREMEQDKDRLRKSAKALRAENEENSTLAYSRKAANIIRKMHIEGHEEMILMQLPTILDPLTRSFKQHYEEIKPDPGATTPNPPVSDNATNKEQKAKESSDLPKGKTIGKLRITKRGRVIICVNGQEIDITHTTHGSMQEGVVAIELSKTEEDAPATGGIFAMSAAQRARQNAQAGNNALYYCGPIKHHMTGSIDWEALRAASLKKIERPTEDLKGPDRSEEKKLRETLDNLEKQRSRLAAEMKELTV